MAFWGSFVSASLRDCMSAIKVSPYCDVTALKPIGSLSDDHFGHYPFEIGQRSGKRTRGHLKNFSPMLGNSMVGICAPIVLFQSVPARHNQLTHSPLRGLIPSYESART